MSIHRHAGLAVNPPRCPVTRSRRVVELCRIGDYQVWRCPESATDFVWPIPSDAELKRYYDRTEWFEGGERGGYENYDRQTGFSLSMVSELLDRFPADSDGRYVLDFGCGYGSHLELAALRGWKCFGVELSDHARKVAAERHGDSMQIVEQVEELIPHEFDLILMLDVLEHVGDPYALLFRLFNRGLIGAKTRLVITTPNARCDDAVRDAGEWAYRHPPSHLVYYSARSLRRLLQTLQFERVEVRGSSPLPSGEPRGFGDEDLSPEESLNEYAGLICEAQGSRFYAFMLERYVPGTWSKLAEYEHLPRYQFAQRHATGAKVLDFGCGTGYGSRYLAEVAEDVLGLDIDEPALAWARFWHEPDRLRFERHADLGAALPSASFDLVTCFEMIEHVDHATQKATVDSLARLVKPTGKLLISTPNPAVTVNYGPNPYHLREMNEAEFVSLLSPHFAHIAVSRQWVRPSILIGSEPIPREGELICDRLSNEHIVDEPPAFIAVCSHQPLETIKPFVTFDSSLDMVLVETQAQKTLTRLRFDKYLLQEARDQAERRVTLFTDEMRRRDESLRLHAEALTTQKGTIDELEALIAEKQIALAEQHVTLLQMHRDFELQAGTIASMRDDFALRDAKIAELNALVAEKQAGLDDQRAALLEMQGNFETQAGTIASMRGELHALQVLDREKDARIAQQVLDLEAGQEARRALEGLLAALSNTRSVRLARILHGNSGSRSPVLEAIYLVAGGLIPASAKARLAPVAAKLRDRFSSKSPEAGQFDAYRIKAPATIQPNRPRVLHVIANFMTGGSSRLVVDLLEHLGGDYEQRILTSFIPSPPNYIGADITEIRAVDDHDAMRAFIERFDPQLIHVHYWGDIDEPWYRAVFCVAQERTCPIVQNINTPVAPFSATTLARNVFVSRYVLEHFGGGQPHNTVIYPGSDFTLFAPSRRPHRAQGCIGMVYRLERDKLDETAIEPFIEAARLLPGLKCLIVGGGSLMQPFKDRVHAENLDDSFEFTGYVSYQKLPALYKRMDVFVAPIWKESFGQVSAFAMNMGIPVIGYDVGAIPEIIADPSLVAPARDAHALATIAVGLVRDDEARALIGTTNRQRAVRMFSVEAMIHAYKELYQELLKQ